MYDILIKGAEIYDGTGEAPFIADVAVSGDRIAAVGQLPAESAKQVVNADGMCLLPGFIDSHTHSDAMELLHHSREEAIRQGITTEVVGSCGIGIVPMWKGQDDYISTIISVTGYPGPMGSVNSVDDYFNAVGNAGTNYAFQVAHSPIRIAAVGNRDVNIGEKEMAAMESVAHKAFEDGACAFSTGLAYYPASYCDTEEVVKLCRVSAEHNAPFTIHQRSVINRHFPNGIDPLGESFEIARKSGVHLHLSHYKTRKATVGQVSAVTGPIEKALAEGMSVTADFYPYPSGCGHINVFLPTWAMEGDSADVLARLADPKLRERIISTLDADPRINDGSFTHAPKHPEYLDRTFADVAKETGEKVSEMLVRFLLEEELEGGYAPGLELSEEKAARFEQDCADLISKPYYMLGSDTLPAQGSPHPRTFDAFPKMVRIANKCGVPIQTLANRMCAGPAKVFGLENRGMIKNGCFADILLYRKNNGKMEDRPQSVFINGVCKLDNGVLSPVMSGQGIRHKGR